MEIRTAEKVMVPYHSISAHEFFPTFENSPKIDFLKNFTKKLASNRSSNLPLPISKRRKILSCLIDVQNS